MQQLKQPKQLLGMAAALLANVIFGFSFLFSKIALQAAHPLVILAVRFTVAFAVLNLLLLTGRFRLRLGGKPLKRLILMGLAQPVCYYLLELYGISLCSSALSGVIIGLVPVAVILFSGAFLGEKPTVLQHVCTVVSLLGVGAISLLSNNGQPSYFLGVVLLVGAVVSAAAFNLLSRSISAQFTAFERTYLMFLLGSVSFNAAAVLVMRGRFFTGLAAAAVQPNFWLAIAYLAVVSSVAAFLLYNYSTTQISAVRSSSFSNIITIVSLLAGVFILKEPFSALQLLLCVPIILGVYGVNRAGQSG